MAKTAASVLISDLAKRLDLDPGSVGDGSAVRADILRQLTISQNEICQAHSRKFLADDTSASLANNASSVAFPTGFDASKAMTVGRSDSDGEIEFVPIDEWYRTRI